MRLFAALLLTLALVAGAESWIVYVNNKPFKGKVSGKPEAMLLDALVLAESTTVGLQVDVEAGTVTLNGEAVPVTPMDGILLIDARDLAKRIGGKYNVNQDLASVDVYLVRPAPAGSKGISGRWVVTDAHVGCCTYRKDVVLNIVDQGGVVTFEYPGGYRFRGKGVGGTYDFTYSGPGSATQMGSGSLTLAADGLTFTGKLADQYGHRATWTGRR